MSMVVEAGMEKLSMPCPLGLGTPCPLGSLNPILQQMVQSGMHPSQLMQGLAAQLLERSLAVTKMVKVRDHSFACTATTHQPPLSDEAFDATHFNLVLTWD